MGVEAIREAEVQLKENPVPDETYFLLERLYAETGQADSAKAIIASYFAVEQDRTRGARILRSSLSPRELDSTRSSPRTLQRSAVPGEHGPIVNSDCRGSVPTCSGGGVDRGSRVSKRGESRCSDHD